jgi:hypothetical protein
LITNSKNINSRQKGVTKKEGASSKSNLGVALRPADNLQRRESSESLGAVTEKSSVVKSSRKAKKDKLTYIDAIFIGYTYKILKDMIEKIKGRDLTKKELIDFKEEFAKKISKEVKQ